MLISYNITLLFYNIFVLRRIFKNLYSDASTLHLNGTQQMTALMPEDSKTQTEEIVVRFKTTRPRGLLLATSLENSSDRLQLYLEEGKAKMLIHIGDKEKVS